MNLEHGIWTLALCILVGIFFEKFAKLPLDRNPVWIIWFAMFIPDIDFVVQTISEEMSPTKLPWIVHGDFHNVGVLILVSLLLGWFIWKYTKIRFDFAVICVAIGFTAHLYEDALCNGIQYHFYRPFSNQIWWHDYIITPDWGAVFANNVIASWNLMYVGVMLVVLAMLVRTVVCGTHWLNKYGQVLMLKKLNRSKLDEPAESNAIFPDVIALCIYIYKGIRDAIISPVKDTVIPKMQAAAVAPEIYSDERFD